MPFLRRGTNPSRAKRGPATTSSPPARSDIGEGSASELIESPQPKKRDPLDAHDFGDGGGGGGAEGFSREKLDSSAKASAKDSPKHRAGSPRR